MKRAMRRVVINPVLNGFIVEVGCQTVVFKTIHDVASALMSYWEDPVGTEKSFISDAVNPVYSEPNERSALGQYGPSVALQSQRNERWTQDQIYCGKEPQEDAPTPTC